MTSMHQPIAPEDVERFCPKCGGRLENIPDMYALRDGSTFPGSVCKPCNSLWTGGCPGFEAFIKHAKQINGDTHD